MGGYKTFANQVPLGADDLNSYLMQQTVIRLPTASAIVSTLGAGVRTGGMLAWADDTQTLYQYSGSGGQWLPELSLWKTFAPNWTAAGTILSPGNAITSYTWRYAGGMVQACYEFTRGSTTNAGSGDYQWGLPVTAATGLGPQGSGIMRDASPYAEYNVGVNPISPNVVGLIYNAARVTNTAPFTVAANDLYGFQVTYRPAGNPTGGAIS